MKSPVDHISRAVLPWRGEEAGLTECGLAAASYPTITREAYRTRREEMGQQRCALFSCMTCADTVTRWSTWAEDPVDAMQRETAKYSRHLPERGEAFRRELLSIAALIANHREEFDAHIAALGAVVKLDEHRKRMKKASADRWSKS